MTPSEYPVRSLFEEIWGEIWGDRKDIPGWVSIASRDVQTPPSKKAKKVRAITVGCGVVIPHSNSSSILTLRRVGGKWPGQLALPGGHPEEGETVHDCAVRETLEETGLIVCPRIVNGHSLIFHTNEDINREDNRWHHFSVYVVADVVGGTLCNNEPYKHRDLAWMTLDRLVEIGEQEAVGLIPIDRILQYRAEIQI